MNEWNLTDGNGQMMMKILGVIKKWIDIFHHGQNRVKKPGYRDPEQKKQQHSHQNQNSVFEIFSKNECFWDINFSNS